MSIDLFLKEKKIISRFSADEITEIIPVSHGNINFTHIVALKGCNGTIHRVVLQKMNSRNFPDVDSLMTNIYNVTEYLKCHLNPSDDPKRSVISVVKTLDGKLYTTYCGEHYRCYDMIENSVSYQKVENCRDFYLCGQTFADFQGRLIGYSKENPCSVIGDYHNTIKRYNDFTSAVQSNKAGRKVTAEKEIDFFTSRKKIASVIMDKLYSGEIPVRLTHNDAKLNNMLFDASTGNALCVIDLDCVMPGAACFDFGDAIRFCGTRNGAENAVLDLNLFEAYTGGFLSTAKNYLTKAEIDTLAVSALVITYECGMRFLTDYLEGDVTFRTGYPLHNLDRTRCHISLLRDMEQKLPLMEKIVLKYAE